MFMGEYAHSLDSKGRLTIPARLRNGLEGEAAVLTRGYDPCLALYPMSEWTRLANEAARLPRTSELRRVYTRRLFASASEVRLDGMGRILIPAFLRSYADLTDQAIVVGVNTHIEIWNPQRWQETWEHDSASLDDILQEIARLSLRDDA